MDDSSYKQALDSIKSEVPTKVKADPWAFGYGIVFVVLGMMLLDVNVTGLAVCMIVVGGLGLIAGAATFFSNSPVVKVFQAVDSFAMVLLFLVFAADPPKSGFLENPLVSLGFAAFMVWSGVGHLREYGRLKQVKQEQASAAQ